MTNIGLIGTLELSTPIFSTCRQWNWDWEATQGQTAKPRQNQNQRTASSGLCPGAAGVIAPRSPSTALCLCESFASYCQMVTQDVSGHSPLAPPLPPREALLLLQAEPLGPSASWKTLSGQTWSYLLTYHTPHQLSISVPNPQPTPAKLLPKELDFKLHHHHIILTEETQRQACMEKWVLVANLNIADRILISKSFLKHHLPRCLTLARQASRYKAHEINGTEAALKGVPGMLVAGGWGKTMSFSPVCFFPAAAMGLLCCMNSFVFQSRREPGKLAHSGHASISTLDVTCSFSEHKGSVHSFNECSWRKVPSHSLWPILMLTVVKSWKVVPELAFKTPLGSWPSFSLIPTE